MSGAGLRAALALLNEGRDNPYSDGDNPANDGKGERWAGWVEGFDAARSTIRAALAQPAPVASADAAWASRDESPLTAFDKLAASYGFDGDRSTGAWLETRLAIETAIRGEGLDVERLGEAMFRVGTGMRARETAGVAARISNSQDGAKAAGEFAALVAAEYARLASTDSETETTDE